MGAAVAGASREAIRSAQVAHLGVFVSPISAWEIATLARKGRIQLTRPPDVWFATLLGLPGVRLAGMPPEVLIASSLRPATHPAIRQTASLPPPRAPKATHS
jgi:PIN domain nuclease of toxin-antitoxin system